MTKSYVAGIGRYSGTFEGYLGGYTYVLLSRIFTFVRSLNVLTLQDLIIVIIRGCFENRPKQRIAFWRVKTFIASCHFDYVIYVVITL